jgi:hypothetical protein
MKIRQIYENLLNQKLRELSQDTGFFQRPAVNSIPLYDAERGFDSDSRATSNTTGKKGIPTSKRHRKFFNISIGPEEMSVQ